MILWSLYFPPLWHFHQSLCLGSGISACEGCMAAWESAVLIFFSSLSISLPCFGYWRPHSLHPTISFWIFKTSLCGPCTFLLVMGHDFHPAFSSIFLSESLRHLSGDDASGQFPWSCSWCYNVIVASGAWSRKLEQEQEQEQELQCMLQRYSHTVSCLTCKLKLKHNNCLE